MTSTVALFVSVMGLSYLRQTCPVLQGATPAIARISEPEAGTFQAELSKELIGIIEANGFKINESKTRIQPWKRSQRVTGLVVNQKVNIPRRFIRRTRAMLHAWEKYGLSLAQEYFLAKFAGPVRNKESVPAFERRVRGNIAYIGQVRGRDDGIYLRFLLKYHALTGTKPTGPIAMTSSTTTRDVFICHASEEKASVVEPLAAAFTTAGISFWYDKAEIKWGDSLTQKVNEGLASSTYVMVVLSKASMEKNWPLKELNASLSREIQQGRVSVLPLMVGTPAEIAEIQSKLPLQADKLYLSWSGNPTPIVDAIKSRLGR